MVSRLVVDQSSAIHARYLMRKDAGSPMIVMKIGNPDIIDFLSFSTTVL